METKEAARISHFEEVMRRAEAQLRDEPKNANAHYLYAYAAGRYSQRISVVKALSQGYGGRIRKALEAALKLVPLIGQACAIGDKRPFVSALVVLDPEVAPVWAAANGLEGLSLAELAEHPDVIAEVERGVDGVMAEFNHAERVKKVTVLGAEWLPDSDELTPTSKLKRRGIHARYAEQIEALYA